MKCSARIRQQKPGVQLPGPPDHVRSALGSLQQQQPVAGEAGEAPAWGPRTPPGRVTPSACAAPAASAQTPFVPFFSLPCRILLPGLAEGLEGVEGASAAGGQVGHRLGDSQSSTHPTPGKTPSRNDCLRKHSPGGGSSSCAVLWLLQTHLALGASQFCLGSTWIVMAVNPPSSSGARAAVFALLPGWSVRARGW